MQSMETSQFQALFSYFHFQKETLVPREMTQQTVMSFDQKRHIVTVEMMSINV